MRERERAWFSRLSSRAVLWKRSAWRSVTLWRASTRVVVSVTAWRELPSGCISCGPVSRTVCTRAAVCTMSSEQALSYARSASGGTSDDTYCSAGSRTCAACPSNSTGAGAARAPRRASSSEGVSSSSASCRRCASCSAMRSRARASGALYARFRQEMQGQRAM